MRMTTSAHDKTPATPRAGAIAAILSIAIAACGGAAPMSSPKAPAERSEPDPATVEEAQARIDRDLETLGGGGRAATGSAAPAEPSPQKHADAPPPAEPGATADADGVGQVCASSCRALASMRRSVEVLCRLAGDSDERCTKARATLSDSETRVSSRACRC
jgi:hypothetical protein